MRSIRSGLVVAALIIVGSLAVTSGASATSIRPVPFQRGVTIADWGASGYASPGFGKLVTSLKRRGVDTVTLLVVWEQNAQSSIKITRGQETVPTANLVNAINTARAAHLRVILKPYIDLRNGAWRGQITPSSVSRWFASYDSFILRYAKLAQQNGVRGFVVGTEMVSMQPYASDWRALISHVRQVFRNGFVTYQANHSETNIAWWDALDVIDISAYYPLNTSGKYDVPDLVSGWSHWSSALGSLHRKYRRDIMFGELGYTPYTGTFAAPWDIEPLGTPSTAAQANGYTAAFDVWYPVTYFKGFGWWYVSSNPALRGTASGNDEPRAPALKVLSHWYRTKKPAG